MEKIKKYLLLLCFFNVRALYTNTILAQKGCSSAARLLSSEKVQRTEIFVEKYCLVLFKVQRTVTSNIAVRCTLNQIFEIGCYKYLAALPLKQRT
jgi:hypothetical protein